ncbi:MAG: hypothetical protein AAGI53_06055 [Planctomycetota bacterium]
MTMPQRLEKPRRERSGFRFDQRPRFAGTNLSPFSVRPTLRLMLEPDEKLIGWGMVQPEPDAYRAAVSIGLMLIPGIGPFLAGIDSYNTLKQQRLAVLTDLRFFLLHPTKKAAQGDQGVSEIFGLGELALEDRDASDQKWIEEGEAPGLAKRLQSSIRPKIARLKISAPGHETRTLRIGAGGSPAAERLVEALRLLAGEDEPESHREASAHAARTGMLGAEAAEDREQPIT